MYGNKEYNLAVALLQFNRAYTALVQASTQLPDMDLSQLYPFYLLDFEELQPAVKQWCIVHATQIMQNVPDRVYNPACVECSFLRAGLDASGACKGAVTVKCCLHPEIMFTRDAVIPFLNAHGVKTAEVNDAMVQLLYVRKAEEVNEESNHSKASSPGTAPGTAGSSSSQ